MIKEGIKCKRLKCNFTCTVIAVVIIIALLIFILSFAKISDKTFVGKAAGYYNAASSQVRLTVKHMFEVPQFYTETCPEEIVHYFNIDEAWYILSTNVNIKEKGWNVMAREPEMVTFPFINVTCQGSTMSCSYQINPMYYISQFYPKIELKKDCPNALTADNEKSCKCNNMQ